MRGLTHGSDDGNFTTRVIHLATTQKRPRNSPSEKLINALHTAFDSMSFDEKDWAFVFSLSHTRVQRRFVNALVKYFAVLAERADKGLWQDEDDMLLVKDGKVIYQAIKFLDN